WTQVLAVTDTTYATAGYLAIQSRASALDEFGGGTIAQQAASAPSNQSLPVLSGSPVVGQTLSASAGSWSGTAPITYTYQWQGCDSSGGSCVAISGATGASYVVASGDLGSTLRVVVTASNAGGQASASSAVSAVVTAP